MKPPASAPCNLQTCIATRRREQKHARECFTLAARNPALIPVQLLVISGFPSAGKTTRALQLKAFFESKIAGESPDSRSSRLKVHLVNHESLGLPRGVYHTARAEKDARAEEYSAVKRLLSRDDIVIADGLNYIKGFRYQLNCEAKAVHTTSCVVSRPAPLHPRRC